MTTNSSLTILLLCWNHARYVEQCIRSLAEQTDPRFEIVYLDNQSEDGSFERAESLFAQYGLEVSMIRNRQSQGISHNLNRLLAKSSGELVCYLSTDDWLANDYVQSMKAAAADDKMAGWFSCSGWLYFDAEKRIESVDETRFVTDRPVGEVILDGGEPYFFVGCTYRRNAVQSVGGWDEDQLIEDRDLFLRLSQRFAHHRVPKRLVFYRRASTTASANARFMLEGWDRFFRKHKALFGRRLAARRAETYRAYAALLIDHRKLGDAFKALIKSLTLRPLDPTTWRTCSYLARRYLRHLVAKR